MKHLIGLNIWTFGLFLLWSFSYYLSALECVIPCPWGCCIIFGGMLIYSLMYIIHSLLPIFGMFLKWIVFRKSEATLQRAIREPSAHRNDILGSESNVLFFLERDGDDCEERNQMWTMQTDKCAQIRILPAFGVLLCNKPRVFLK